MNERVSVNEQGPNVEAFGPVNGHLHPPWRQVAVNDMLCAGMVHRYHREADLQQ